MTYDTLPPLQMHVRACRCLLTAGMVSHCEICLQPLLMVINAGLAIKMIFIVICCSILSSVSFKPDIFDITITSYKKVLYDTQNNQKYFLYSNMKLISSV